MLGAVYTHKQWALPTCALVEGMISARVRHILRPDTAAR